MKDYAKQNEKPERNYFKEALMATAIYATITALTVWFVWELSA